MEQHLVKLKQTSIMDLLSP